MLSIQPSLNCVFSGHFERQKAMKNGENNNHLVFTLEDDISDEVLKSKREEDKNSGSSSVALWIKSLKENNFGCDESESHSLAGSSSDQDDLHLGAEATDLRKKHKTHIHRASYKDSDSDSSVSRWYSWTGRRSFLTNRLSYDRSLDSDTSGLSSVTSVSSLLTARESDPEDVLKGLGFRGPNVYDKIPDRFIDTGTVCDGVDSDQFLCSVQDDSTGAMYRNSEIPPWVMARFDDIPKKFWNQKDDPSANPESTNGQGVPVINKPLSEDGKEEIPNLARPPKTCPSKFGTYLEPVTEEAELSSQGSVCLSPILKTSSFESTRSTLKANSQDGPSESMPKVPSLCDLWQTTEDEQQWNSEAIRSNDHGIIPDDIRENIPGEIDQCYDEDWMDKSREDSPIDQWSPKPTILDNQLPIVESIPAIPRGQWFPPQTDSSVPALSAYFANDNTLVSEDNRDSSPPDSKPIVNRFPDVIDNDLPKISVKHSISNESDSQTIMTQKHSKLTIPTVTISEPVEKSRKISTVEAPDSAKLLPASWRSEKTEHTKAKDNTQMSPTQLNLSASHKWSVFQNKRQPQIQFSNKGRPKSSRRMPMRSRRTADIKVTVSVSQCKMAKQCTLPKFHFESIQCFSDVDFNCYSKLRKSDFSFSETNTVRSCGSSETCKREERISISLPLQQAETTNLQRHLKPKFGEIAKLEGERMARDFYSEGQITSRKDDYMSPTADVSKSTHEARLKSELAIEEELDGLQNSLKGVKMYKAGIHLMQLASSVETVMCSEKRPKGLQIQSSERLLNSIQNELRHLEDYILRLQEQMKEIKQKNPADREETNEDVQRRGSDFSDITKQLLQEQLKMFNSISSSAVSPSSTPSGSVSHAESLCSETPDVLRHTDVMKLRKEIKQLRQDSEDRTVSMKEEILAEVRTEIRNCFKEFLQTKPQ